MGQEGISERGVACLGIPRNYDRPVDLSVNSVINLVFQDEATPYGADFFPAPNPPNFTYVADVTNVRIAQNTLNYSISGVYFRVNTGPGDYPNFRNLVLWTFTNNGGYTPPNNLSDFGDFYSYRLDVVQGSNPQYYLDQIVSGLNSLGVSINC
jgi:hypothetical protein